MTHAEEHRIDVVPLTVPIKSKKFRMSPQQEEEVKRQAEEMVKNGIASPSASPWGSNVILVKKRDGSMRFAIDYRKLNDVTVKDSYPMPNVRDIVDRMKGSEYFSKMDMASAYWAIPIREEDKEKTAFFNPRSLFEMNVLAFGLCNSQATYQRTMDKTFEDVTEVDSFIDDVIQYAKGFDDMLSTLREVFTRFQENNLQMRVDKCRFLMQRGRVLWTYRYT